MKTKSQIPIKVDNDPSIGYEKNHWTDVCKWPLMWGLALWVFLKKKILGPRLKINTFWFDGLSAKCRKVKENATTWRALDIIYNHKPGRDKSIEGRVTDFWNNVRNIKAVRNRLRLAKKQLKENIKNLAKEEKKKIRLLSIASGSAQGVIEVIKEFKGKGISVEAIFLDLDPTAIEHSKKLSREAGIIDRITFVNKSTREIERIGKEFGPHIVEIIGFLEYRPDEKAIDLLRRIYNILSPGGILLTSNISPNPEMFFSHWVGNWPMIYRWPENFFKIIQEAGFPPENCRIIQEPLRIHNIAICKKP